ncbi:hypothetical protein GVO02_17775 [Aeromonas caviae]|nr:hypothetical protein VI35_06315 [Aeromonas caviae]AUT44257.1 hypothetical protein C2U30_06620 [Aeromonas sp. ASNIH5]AUV14728.1 hypothetical protein C2U39_06955 [Aeromonas sp. ASNIH3]AUV19198.1 hypothetical protein C2U47_17570 [Aeromonas sp. ASNIH7]AUY12252.1 hypothetical protein C3F36_18100 [Aeromonas sp. ASNIH2]AUZ82541.1 hypothetical protein C2U37_15675 [Aeromonas sp. ASNIH1]POV93567.1 hypothetical protein C3418_01650 [Aeromonas sp. ASNIH8]PZR01871.1 MAG: hypothetical protein DI541_0406
MNWPRCPSTQSDHFAPERVMTNQATAGTPTCDCKLWDILVESAKERTTIRYSKLARQAGLEQCQDELRTLLQRIRMYCTENHLPILSAIVMDDVGKYAGLSSSLPDAPWERARVFDHEWTTLH